MPNSIVFVLVLTQTSKTVYALPIGIPSSCKGDSGVYRQHATIFLPWPTAIKFSSNSHRQGERNKSISFMHACMLVYKHHHQQPLSICCRNTSTYIWLAPYIPCAFRNIHARSIQLCLRYHLSANVVGVSVMSFLGPFGWHCGARYRSSVLVAHQWGGAASTAAAGQSSACWHPQPRRPAGR